jgi:hypothetical protein
MVLISCIAPEAAPELLQEKEKEATEESGSQGAFNEETGEINWDCPVCSRTSQSSHPPSVYRILIRY